MRFDNDKNPYLDEQMLQLHFVRGCYRAISKVESFRNLRVEGFGAEGSDLMI